MNSILTDSLVREHADSLAASTAASRRARDARLARRDVRRAERTLRREHSEHVRATALAHAATRPFAVARQWLVAGQL